MDSVNTQFSLIGAWLHEFNTPPLFKLKTFWLENKLSSNGSGVISIALLTIDMESVLKV